MRARGPAKRRDISGTPFEERPVQVEETRGKVRVLIQLLSRIGAATLRLLGTFGSLAIFFGLVFVNIFKRKQLAEIISQVYFIGARSSLIAIIVALFTGMVLGLQLFF